MKIKNPKLSPVVNGFKIDYDEYADAEKTKSNPYNHEQYIGRKEEFFKAAEEPAAMVRFKELAKLSGNLSEETYTVTEGGDALI